MMDKFRSYSRLAFMILSLLVLYALFQALFTKLVFSAYSFLYPGISAERFVAGGDAGLQNGTYYMLVSVALLLSAIAMLLFLHLTGACRFRKGMFTSIGGRPMLLSVLLVFSSIWGLNIFVQWFPLEDMLESQFEGLSHDILGAISISVMAPLLEETLFRGAILGALLRRTGNPWHAIIISALIFGIFHMNPIQVVYATLLGMVLGWIYYRTRNLLSVIVGHVLNNTIATLTMLFSSSAADVAASASGVAYDSATVIMFVIFLALSIFLAVKLHRSLPAVPAPWHESDRSSDNDSSGITLL